MIYHLLWYWREVVTHRVGFYAYQSVGFRSVAAILTSLLIALVVGPRIIRWLMRKKIGDRPEFHHATLNELTKEKANTPTMGGLIIIISAISTTLLWARLNNPFVQKAIVLLIWFAALGEAHLPDRWSRTDSVVLVRRFYQHRGREAVLAAFL